jgi:hypothetical protein
VGAVPSVLGAAPLEGEQETDNSWDEDYCADDVELKDPLYDGFILGVVVAVNL